MTDNKNMRLVFTDRVTKKYLLGFSNEFYAFSDVLVLVGLLCM